MFVCASTRCYNDRPLEEACKLLDGLEFDKFEIWVGADSTHISAEEIAADPDDFAAMLRSASRMSPVAFHLTDDSISTDTFAGITRTAKLLRVTQITVPSAPLGTPFNSEIDRLKELVLLGSRDGIRVSIKTEKGRLAEDPHTAVEFCQSIKGLGLTLDPSYYLASPLGDKACDMAYPHTLHVHLRDSTTTQLQVPVGQGEFDYGRLITQLQRQQYQRGLSIDLIPEKCEVEQRPLELRTLRMLLTTLL
ncbi:MAG: sugar phosphate isomerase/epimerase [Planctomycetaceae bacterium]